MCLRHLLDHKEQSNVLEAILDVSVSHASYSHLRLHLSELFLTILVFKSLITVLRLLIPLIYMRHVRTKALLSIAILVLNELNEDTFTGVNRDMNILNLLQQLATLFLVQHEVDAHVHDELALQDLLYFIDVGDLVKVDRHLKLLVVTAFDETLRTNEREDYHAHIGRRGFLRAHLRVANELTYIHAHRVKFVDEDLVNLQLRLKLVLSLVILLDSSATIRNDFARLLGSASARTFKNGGALSGLRRHLSHLLLK